MSPNTEELLHMYTLYVRIVTALQQSKVNEDLLVKRTTIFITVIINILIHNVTFLTNANNMT